MTGPSVFQQGPGGPPRPGLTQLGQWMVDAFKGRVPLSHVFWVGGVAWVLAFFASRGLIIGFTQVQLSGGWDGYDPTLVWAISISLRVINTLAWAIFIWWCISVWQCADHEPGEFRRRSMRTVVAVLVILNAVSVLR